MSAETAVFPHIPCPVCAHEVTEQLVQLRDGSTSFLLTCSGCRFSFFDVDPTPLLEKNKLDELRLQKAGIEVPEFQEDYANGSRQAAEYVAEFLPEKGEEILEVGCSWGYFLEAVADHGSMPTGIEINPVRRQHVTCELNLPCYASIYDLPDKQFDKIFLFYVLEYFRQPLVELGKLIEHLKPGGKLFAITPNHDDALITMWRNNAYQNFIYDACAINYFTSESLECLADQLKGTTSQVSTRQGYSFANHLNWHLSGGPMKTGCVGKDRIVEDICHQLAGQQQLAELLSEFDSKYRQLCSSNGAGNQIHLQLSKH